MMAFITHYLKSARLDLVGVLTCLCLAWGLAGSARAQAPSPEVSDLQFSRSGDVVWLSATVKFDLPAVIEDALLKGVSVIFVAEADVYKERWYWTDKKVAAVVRHLRLAYQPLTRRWRLNVSTGASTNSGLAVALTQYFDNLPEALAALQRFYHWKIAEASEIDFGKQHFVEFRFRLDASQLPRLLQIGTLGQSDWNLSVSTGRPLVIENPS